MQTHLRWFGQVKTLDDLFSVINMALPEKRGLGRPLKIFEACVDGDTNFRNLRDYDPLNRHSSWGHAIWYSRQVVLPPVGELE